MIVADSNTIAYLYLPTQYTADVEQLLLVDDEWVAPYLWRSEFRNILALYLRKNIIDLTTALKMQQEAESLMKDNEYHVDSFSVLSLAHKSGCSAYDCEFVHLAQSLNIKLVTGDKKIQNAFPCVALSASDYLKR